VLHLTSFFLVELSNGSTVRTRTELGWSGYYFLEHKWTGYPRVTEVIYFGRLIFTNIEIIISCFVWPKKFCWFFFQLYQDRYLIANI